MLISQPPPSLAIPEQHCRVSEAQSLPQLTGATTQVGSSGAQATALAATHFAHIATSNHPQQKVSELLTAQLARHTGNTLEQYLDRWGRVQIRLGINPRQFSLDSSQITALFPLWRSQALPEHQLFFTQFGLHHQHHHETTVNLGIGQRHLPSEKWMLGYNLFYDVLFPHHHQRLGVGVEARRDYLSLAINGYCPISQWKSENQSDHSMARPARGVDMIAEAYLPQHPQLGVKVTAEHYFDDQVAAFTPNAKQRVASVTLGLHYTPVPLFKLSYDYTLGQRAANRCRQQVALAVDYQLGIPLAQQLESHRVASQRSLIGSLLEPVQRNNQILLAYKEKAGTAGTAGQLQLPHEDELGNIGDVLTIPVTLQGDLSAYTLSFAGSLAAAAQASTDHKTLTVRLPPTVGQHTLQVIATDQQGKVVHSNEMTIHVLDAGDHLPVIRKAYKNILTPGVWNGREDDLVKVLLPQILIWPANTDLLVSSNNIEHRFHTTNRIIFGDDQPDAANTIDLLQLPGHYQFLSGSIGVECGGGGDCFYYSAAEGLKRRGIPTTMLELRRMSAQALLAHYNDEGVVETLTS